MSGPREWSNATALYHAFPEPSQTAQCMTNAERVAAQFSVREICDGLRLKIQECPQPGMRGQMLNCLEALVRSGGPELILGW